MAAVIKPWSEAPLDATHQHTSTGAWYKIEDGKVRVFGGNKKWNNSKVLATSAMLNPRPVIETKEPTEMEQLIPTTIEASSPEELATKLEALGLDDEQIAQIVFEITGATVVKTEEEVECNCVGCNPDARAETGKKVGKLLAHTLKRIKEDFELDFDVQDIMRQIGFVKQDEPTNKHVPGTIDDAMMEKLIPVAERIIEETGMPPQVAVAGIKQVFTALDAEGLIKH